MAASNLNLGKASGGVLNIQPTDGTTTTSIVLPASGTVTTNEYVNSNNLGNGSTTFNGFGGTGFKNYIINGNFNIWQRGTSFTGLTNGSYSADRWVVFDSVGDVAYNCIRNAGVFDSGYGGTFTFTGGTGNKSIIQFIENVTKFPVGSTFTLSFEAFSSSNITISPVIQGVRGTWSLNTSVVSGSVSSITITPTKTKYSVTFSIPDWASVINSDWSTLNDTKLAVKFDIAAGVGIGTTINLGNVQFEKGSVATPFEQRPYGTELALCQRYFYRLPLKPSAFNDGYNGAQGYIVQTCPIPVTMRTTPTVTAPGSSGFTQTNVLSQEFYAMNENSLIWLLRATAAGRLYSYPTTTTQNVDCSSEL